ncbi:MAG: Sec-independent protein translocase protein TatB [Stellaceae bacterium]
MLFDFGWSEILLIGVVALVFVGPKDLPKAMRVAGYWIRKARTLSREFQGSIDQLIREAELDEVRQQLKKAAEFDLDKEFQNTIDPEGSLREHLAPPQLPSLMAPGSPLPAAEAAEPAMRTIAAPPPAGDAAPAAAVESHPRAATIIDEAPAGEPPPEHGRDPIAIAADIVPPRP